MPNNYLQKTTIYTACKINLYLRITGCLPCGYHTLDTVFLRLKEPFDTLHISKKEGTGLSLVCNNKEIDTQNNTLTKAYEAYALATHFAPKIHLSLEKNIPLGAGLGGASGNAAGFLQYLQEINPKPLSKKNLHSLASTIGKDVPFFLEESTACHASGLGDTLSPIDIKQFTGLSLPLYGLLCMPKIHVSTPWAYGAWDRYAKDHSEKRPLGHCATKYLVKKQEEEKTSKVLWLENSFEGPVFAKHPELAQLKHALYLAKARAVLLSGSGASVFAFFEKKENIEKILEQKSAKQGFFAMKNIESKGFAGNFTWQKNFSKMLKKNIDVLPFSVV